FSSTGFRFLFITLHFLFCRFRFLFTGFRFLCKSILLLCKRKKRTRTSNPLLFSIVKITNRKLRENALSPLAVSLSQRSQDYVPLFPLFAALFYEENRATPLGTACLCKLTG